MPDLVQKYFQEDLTAEEQETLENLLENSEEAAWRFGQASEKAYYRFGLPKPRFPGPPGSTGGGAGLKLWLGLSILVAGAATLWLWKHPTVFLSRLLGRASQSSRIQRPQTALLTGSTPSGRLPQANSPAHGAAQGHSLKTGQDEDPVWSKPPNPGGVQGTSPAPALGQGNRVSPPTAGISPPLIPSAPARPVMTPINLDEAPSRSFSNISVRIDQAEPGYVEVKVLDMRDLPVTPLYQGNLGPGHWVFEWDGRLSTGQKAAPGYYQIEVKSGSYVQRKNIQIR